MKERLTTEILESPRAIGRCVPRLALFASVGAWLLVGCAQKELGDGGSESVADGGPPPQGDAGTRADVASEVPLKVASEQGCRIDAECAAGRYCFQSHCSFECTADADCESDESCSERGRCVLDAEALRPSEAPEAASPSADSLAPPAPPAAALPEFDAEVTVLGTSPQVVEVGADDEFATLTLTLDGPLAPVGLAYRVERDDVDEDDPSNSAIHRAHAEGEAVTIEIPTGMARAGVDGSRRVHVQIISALGTYSMTLVPEAPQTGNYAGSVRTPLFGNVGLPMVLDLVTSPENAPLDEAEQAWLVLPASDDSLFAPFRGLDDTQALEVPLEYDASLDRWVGISEAEFTLDDRSSLFHVGRHVARIQRYEIAVGATLTGVVSDRWEGLYDARSDLGVVTPADIVFEGEIELERVGPRAFDKPLSAPPAPALAVPLPLPAPEVNACSDSALFADIDADAESPGACDGISSAAEFEGAAPEDQAACALAMADAALGGETTGAVIRAFLAGDGEPADGQSFADFMRDCADETTPTCQPSAAVLCARQLVARASFEQEPRSGFDEALTKVFQDLSSEAFLGRQLAAFQTNADTRLRWLRTTDYPAVVTSAVKSNIAALLEDWKRGVLDPHMAVLSGYFDDSGLSVLSRSVGGEAKDARRRLLDQMIQGWRGAMDALTLGASRWDELYQDQDSRAERASFVRSQMRDLYLLAGLLGNLTRDAGSGYQASAFGSGFSELMKRAGKLDLSFDNLVFARDAEVVVSKSVDPMGDNAMLIGKRQDDAEQATEEAQQAVAQLLEDDTREQKEQLDYEARISGDLSDVRRELVNLCGLPEGCTADGLDVNATPAECRVRTAPGQCGFSVDRDTDALLGFADGANNTSEAASALLTLADAAEANHLAEEERRAFTAKVTHEVAYLDALAARIEEWNALRREQWQALSTLVNEQDFWEDAGLAELADNLQARHELRLEAIANSEEGLATWNQIVTTGQKDDNADALTIASRRRKAARAESDARFASDVADAAAEAIAWPFSPVAFAKGLAKGAGAGASYVYRNKAVRASYEADKLEVQLESQRALRDIELEKLDRQDAVEDAVTEDELAELEAALQVAQAQRSAHLAQLQRAYELAKADRDAQIAYGRDLAELDERRKVLLQMVEDEAGYRIRKTRAELAVQARLTEYTRVVQRAQLLEGRLTDLLAQRSDMDRLLGSPATLFTRSNRLEQAERQLQHAKDALMDWLVALEYYAVRPFVDQRLQILLARNPYQLEAIAKKLANLQDSCGGRSSEEMVELSVRDQLFRLRHPLHDAAFDVPLSAADQFRAILRQGDVPVDKRVRYGVHSDVQQLLQVDGRVLATTLDVNLGQFANLSAVCNAKLSSFEVLLVGAETTARPTVSVLYDGTAQLASCQKDIGDLVERIGRDRTAFDSITQFRVPGVVASPVASVNAWPAERGTGNRTLEGLPIASQYTVLIDTRGGENRDFDWARLEDIRLRLHYTYNDPFVGDACQP